MSNDWLKETTDCINININTYRLTDKVVKNDIRKMYESNAVGKGEPTMYIKI